MRAEKRIVQIIPADDWCVVCFSGEAPFYSLYAVACFALVEYGDGERGVVGMDAGDYIDFADEGVGFHGYARKDEIDDEIRAAWTEEGRRRMALQQGDVGVGTNPAPA
jgi:hypothetical protein